MRIIRWLGKTSLWIIPFLYFLTLPRFICFNYAADGTVVFLANALTSFAVSPARTGRTRCHAGEDDLGCSRFRRLRVSAERGACWEAHHHDHPIPQQQAGHAEVLFKSFWGPMKPHPALGVCYHSVYCGSNHFSYCVSTLALRLCLQCYSKCFPRQIRTYAHLSANCSPSAATVVWITLWSFADTQPLALCSIWRAISLWPFAFPQRGQHPVSCGQLSYVLALRREDWSWRH